MKVLVTGGRDFSDYDFVEGYLWTCVVPNEEMVLIHGAATGADTLAARAAEKLGWTVRPYPVTPEDWARYGRRAGPIRNSAMLKDSKPDLVIAFPGGTGTADMVKKAKAAGVRTVEVEYRPRFTVLGGSPMSELVPADAADFMVIAQRPDEMRAAQEKTIAWVTARIVEARLDFSATSPTPTRGSSSTRR
jgi:ABC-type Fe3+-hydroxamate transport system substrate-binding protein